MRRDGVVLVDAGLGVRRTVSGLAEGGVGPNEVKAVFLTHEHGDHSSAAGALARRFGVPIHATPGTLSRVRDLRDSKTAPLAAGFPVEVAGLSIRAFPVHHDAAQPVGYRVESPDGGIGIVTDTGRWDDVVARHLRGLDAVLVESNHDEDLLLRGRYPAALQRRIQGNRGHLSNDECGRLLTRVVGQQTRRVVLGHLSRHNNTPELALATSHALLERASAPVPELVAALQDRAVGPWSV